MNQNKFSSVASRESVEKAISALKENGIEAYFVENRDEARKKVFEILPEGAEVMTMTSVTLDILGISKEINESGRYNSVRVKFAEMDPKTDIQDMKKLGAAPEWTIGSVHAVTEDGHIMIASKTGSQLPAYAYGAGRVLWVVGAQKIVENFNEGLKRIYEYVLPLENERAVKIYGAGSEVNKLLIVNKEFEQGRIYMVIVNEALGF